MNALEISIEYKWIVYNESFIECFDIELQFGLSFCIALGMTVLGFDFTCTRVHFRSYLALSLCPSFSLLRLPPSLSLSVFCLPFLPAVNDIFHFQWVFSIFFTCWVMHTCCLFSLLSLSHFLTLSRSLFRSLTLSDRWHCLPLFLLLFVLPTLPLSACLSSLYSLLISLRQCIIIKH